MTSKGCIMMKYDKTAALLPVWKTRSDAEQYIKSHLSESKESISIELLKLDRFDAAKKFATASNMECFIKVYG